MTPFESSVRVGSRLFADHATGNCAIVATEPENGNSGERKQRGYRSACAWQQPACQCRRPRVKTRDLLLPLFPSRLEPRAAVFVVESAATSACPRRTAAPREHVPDDSEEIRKWWVGVAEQPSESDQPISSNQSGSRTSAREQSDAQHSGICAGEIAAAAASSKASLSVRSVLLRRT
jgi:hypothetical protein